MKKLLSAAAVALLSTAGVAQADDIAFSGQTPGIIGGTTSHSTTLGYAVGLVLSGGVGYSQWGLNDGNSQAASPTVTNTWLIKGSVSKDCSYYGGSSTAHTLDFGTIGVNTNSNTNVNSAFDMMSSASAVVNSTTAGCNFNNTVTLKKNQLGLVNAAAGGYDSDEFQANIPYSATATFEATTNTSAGASGSTQNVVAAAGDAQKVWTGGAWRSDMTLTILAPAPSKALVAGNYSDTLTVELKAL
ncbi:hypothetical protein RZN05_15260 [Sphingomonas sp. HF-S4]|uniref:WxL domain-containing protein n=1 Tax=Sphingomonas agrestis TaxID=3080540 RepID=A0ABU3YAD0_9SPHN|nr:hypothetical protein [Sphingomonas sp. HF-S4]MDV3458355.1 hypothetical protein [Sphingomonas sp. HF-S4]